MATIVVYGGGFQPFHEGHLSSYVQAKKAFPDATFYIAASNDVKQRPIPFKDKQFLAQQAGVVDPMSETKNPMNPKEILAQYDPNKDIYIMVRSERDPVPYTKQDGSPAYYQPYVKGQPMAPFSQHGYVFVTKKHNFTVDGEEVYSGSQVRNMYGSADDAGRMNIINQLYPKSKQQPMIKQLLDKYLASPQEPVVTKPKTTAMSKLKNKQLAEQIRKMRPLLKEASPAMKLKFMKLMKTAMSESVVAEATFKKNPYGRTAASQQRARELLNPPKPQEPKKDEKVAESSEEKDNLISMLNSFGYYSDNSSVYVNDGGDKIVRVGSEWKHQSGKRGRGPEELGNFLSSIQDVAEGSQIWDGTDWRPQGRFAGDTPINVGGGTVKPLQVGDIVTYFGQKAKILAQSKPSGIRSRIEISKGMGSVTQDVLTSDLKRLGGSVTESNVSESTDYLEEK